MKTLVRNSLVQAAAAAAVCVVAFSVSGQTATAKVEARHPDMAVAQAFDILEQSGQFAPAARHVTGPGKGDLLAKQANCSTWPYIAAECLTGTAPARQVSRTITIEKRTGETSSALTRVSADQQMAAR